MKNYFIATLVLFLSGTALADGLAENVVADFVTAVGFAPPDYRGIYHFQVLDSGVVQTIDNKGKTARLAKLAPSLIQKLVDKIDQIEDDKLTTPTTPPCMDAPTQSLYVQTSKGKQWKPWARTSCRNSESVDENGAEVSRILIDLKDALRALAAL